MEAVQTTAESATRPRPDTEQFIAHTETVLDRLRAELRDTATGMGADQARANRLAGERLDLISGLTVTLLPNLNAITLGLLNIKVPGFLDARKQREINAAQTVRAPLFTWLFDPLFGGCARFRQEQVDRVLVGLRMQLKSWLDHAQPRPQEVLKGIGVLALEDEIAKLEERIEGARERTPQLRTQISQLEQVLRVYGRPGAPEPSQDLREAIAKSAEAAAAPQGAGGSAPSGGTTVINNYGGDGLSFWDYMLMERLLEQDRVVNNTYYIENDPPSSGFDRDYAANGNADLGGSMQLTNDPSPDTGGGSVTLSADDSADTGGGSVDLAQDDGGADDLADTADDSGSDSFDSGDSGGSDFGGSDDFSSSDD